MGIIEDILNALDRIPIWKRLQALPSEVEHLKTRIAEPEEKLGGKWPAEVCRYCGERAARLSGVSAASFKEGTSLEQWKCEKCQKIDERMSKASPR